MISTLRKDRTIFEHFCRAEEYSSVLTDRFGRFPYYASRHKDVFEPSVSRFLKQNGHELGLGRGGGFTVCLTHDVDALEQGSLRQFGAAFAKDMLRGDFRGALARRSASPGRGPLGEIRSVIDLERRYGAKSTFFFLSVDGASEDHEYDVGGLGDVFGHILDEGFEVGLHGSRRAFDDLGAMVDEKERLEAVVGRRVSGYRNHYLRFRTPLTWNLLREAGFRYDSTLGYADCVGFRNGMCHPFRPYDANAERTIDIVEVPLVIMEQTLFGDYMRLDPRGAWDLVRRLIDVVEGLNGTITLLWHTNYMYGDYLKLYEKTLQYCHQKKANMTSGEEVVDLATSAGI